jgi:hypothetical protein
MQAGLGTGAVVSTPIEQDETARLRAEIERTREQLGDSVDALAAKFDVPARVHDAAARRVEPVRRLAGGAAALTSTATGVAWGLARDGIGIGVALARWGAGSVAATVQSLTGRLRGR